MGNLVKIRELSTQYDISARTLRYYEDMGLIESSRSDGYAYRMYDERAVKRLEQILILRRLNISVKDIKRIFSTEGSKVVLEVLEKKVDDIDGEARLLHELKKIILEFIDQIKKINFENQSDIKLLYEKTKIIETQITNVDYNGNAASSNRFIEITDKLDQKIPEIMIVRVPAFRALTSGVVTYEELFGNFNAWQEAHNHLIEPILFDAGDFLFDRGGMAEWIWRVRDGVTEADTEPYQMITHPGGLYAVAVSVDADDESGLKVLQKIEKWIDQTNFVIDSSRGVAVHMIYVDEEIKAGLGYDQLNLYVPIKLQKD